ncbi:MAG: type II toxin-antitoxin system VapC family toxin [Oscillospiraceae bacterium]|nr:type II toxin-antitoxin system VapC family toxin [Oscillospiraceae bacterium]
MKLLLDTHTVLWYANEHEQLSQKAKEHIFNENNPLYMSIASAWEVAIKCSINKLTEFRGGVDIFLDNIKDSPIEIIGVLPRHVKIVETLPFIHRDPFDRIIIATALAENMTILTADGDIKNYDVACLW